MKIIRVVAAIIEKDNKILIAKRGYGDFEGLWEFPGGKYEEGETGEEAIFREIKEEFDIAINVKKFLCTVDYDYPTFHLNMDCYVCSLNGDDFHLHDHSAIRWIEPDAKRIRWVPADKLVIKEYRKSLK